MPTPSDTTTTVASSGILTIERHACFRSRAISGYRAARSFAWSYSSAADACTPSPASARRPRLQRSGMSCFSSAETLSGPGHAVLPRRQRPAHRAVLLHRRRDLEPRRFLGVALDDAQLERAIGELALQRQFPPLTVVRRHQDGS